jgi:hypothetical protein
LSREEFGLQAEGENRRTEPLRPGLSGFMAALKTRGTARAWGEGSFLFPHVFLACSLLQFVLLLQTPTSCVDGVGQRW